MIPVLFKKILPKGLFEGSDYTTVYRLLDVPIIQPGLYVRQSPAWSVKVEQVVVHDGKVIAICEKSMASLSWNKTHAMAVDHHVTIGWYTSAEEATAAYLNQKAEGIVNDSSFSSPADGAALASGAIPE